MSPRYRRDVAEMLAEIAPAAEAALAGALVRDAAVDAQREAQPRRLQPSLVCRDLTRGTLGGVGVGGKYGGSGDGWDVSGLRCGVTRPRVACARADLRIHVVPLAAAVVAAGGAAWGSAGGAGAGATCVVVVLCCCARLGQCQDEVVDVRVALAKRVSFRRHLQRHLVVISA